MLPWFQNQDGLITRDASSTVRTNTYLIAWGFSCWQQIQEAKPDSLPSCSAGQPLWLPSALGNIQRSKDTQGLPPCSKHQQVCGRARSFIIAVPDRCFLLNLHDLPNKFQIKAWRPNSLLYLSISFWERECLWTWPDKSSGIHSAIQLHSLYFPFSSSHLGFHILMQFYAYLFHYIILHFLSIITGFSPIN